MSDERIDLLSERLDRLAEGQVRGFTRVTEAIAATNERLDRLGAHLGERLDQLGDRMGHLGEEIAATNERLDWLAEGQVRGFTRVAEGLVATNERLDRMGRDQVRGLTAVVDAIGGMRQDFRDGLDRLGDRFDGVLTGVVGQKLRTHDDAIRDLQDRVTRLERDE
jgi:hypothetical protein